MGKAASGSMGEGAGQGEHDPREVATFYRFVALDDLPHWQLLIEEAALTAGLKGTVLLAAEGINGTLAGTAAALREFAAQLLAYPQFADMPIKYSSAQADNRVFHRMKVRVKQEIVALGRPDIDPGQGTGEHVSAQRWNQLLADESIPVLDVRNHYETGIGSFDGALDPNTESFREFPDYVSATLDPQANPRVAMFCTGGIRCEKASAYLLEQGFAEVYQLDGGILNYLANVDPQDNRFVGECFVFDQRVSVNAALEQGEFVQCFACRRPLTQADTQSVHYVEGQSCPHCVDQLSARQREAFAERQRQIELAAARGDQHIGAAPLSGNARAASDEREQGSKRIPKAQGAQRGDA